MPTLAAITINDGATTPVAHTFSPVTTDGFIARLQERVGVPVAQPALSVSLREPVKNGSVYREKFVINVPKTAVVDGKTVVTYSNSATVELVLDEQGAEQDRKDIRMLLVNLLQHADIVKVVDKLEPLY